MTRGQCAIICAFLGAIAVGVFIVAYMANVGLDGGGEIKQHARGVFILIGAGVGFVVGGIFGSPSKPGDPNTPGQVKINEKL